MIRVFSSYEELSNAAAKQIVLIGRQRVAERGRFDLILAGGKTPRRTYEILSETTHSDRTLWKHTHIFWSDERCVLSDHPESNYGIAKIALLDFLRIPPQHIHRIPGENPDPGETAKRYESEFPLQPDLVMLGCGEDGHTASLFAGSPALDESKRRFAAVEAPVEPRGRITMTPPAIAAARTIFVLAAGSSKAAALRHIFSKAGHIHNTPARLVRDAIWFVDKDAAAQLNDLKSEIPEKIQIEGVT